MHLTRGRYTIMKLPTELVLLRHGQSEGNIASRASRDGDHSHYTPEFRTQSSMFWRLTPTGRKQAEHARDWMKRNQLTDFDLNVHSDMTRAIETAHIAAPGINFCGTSLVRERSWGVLDTLPHNEKHLYPGSNLLLRDKDPLSWHPPGGETMWQVMERVRRFLNNLSLFSSEHRTVRVVCHGEVMWAFRYILEHMSPQEYRLMYNSEKSEHIMYNCHLLHYKDNHQGSYRSMYSVCTYKPERYESGWLSIN